MKKNFCHTAKNTATQQHVEGRCGLKVMQLQNDGIYAIQYHGCLTSCQNFWIHEQKMSKSNRKRA